MKVYDIFSIIFAVLILSTVIKHLSTKIYISENEYENERTEIDDNILQINVCRYHLTTYT